MTIAVSVDRFNRKGIMDSFPVDPNDPRSQRIVFHHPDGTPISVNLMALDLWSAQNIKNSINFGAQIGASLVALVAFLLASKPDKRRSTLFALNTASLVLCVIQMILKAQYYTSGWVEVYATVSGDYGRVSRGDYARPIVADVFHVLLLACVEASLIIQFRAVCGTLPRRYRLMLLGLMCAMAGMMLALDSWMTAVNSIGIMKEKGMRSFETEALVISVVLDIFIAFFCIASLFKLGHAVRARRKLGMSQFGPTSVIFIMAFESMLLVRK